MNITIIIGGGGAGIIRRIGFPGFGPTDRPTDRYLVRTLGVKKRRKKENGVTGRSIGKFFFLSPSFLHSQLHTENRMVRAAYVLFSRL